MVARWDAPCHGQPRRDGESMGRRQRPPALGPEGAFSGRHACGLFAGSGRLATSSTDKSARVWDASDGRSLLKLPATPARFWICAGPATERGW